MATPVITTASFCTGVGWLDEGVRAGLGYLGYGHRTALLCEWESYAAATLLARMEDKAVEPAPIWCGDMRDLDARVFRGLVDVAVAGLPCQPYSAAGKQLGIADARTKSASASASRGKSQEPKESSEDRIRRLFYVTCSRSKSSLAVVVYSDNPEAVKKHAVDKQWFEPIEIEEIVS